MRTGQLLDCPGELELDRPRKFGRHVAHGHIVTPRRGFGPAQAYDNTTAEGGRLRPRAATLRCRGSVY